MKSIATSTILLFIVSGQSFGQTQEVFRDIGYRGTALQNWTDVGKIVLAMSVKLDMTEFKGSLTLKEALSRCYQQLDKNGVCLPIVVDSYGFSEEAKEKGRDLDVLATKVKFDGAHRSMPAGDFLRLALKQIPTGNAALVIYGDSYFVEVTTIRRANGRWVIPSTLDLFKKGSRVKRKEAALAIPPLQGLMMEWFHPPRAIALGYDK